MKVISLQSFCFIVYWPCCVIGSERLFASYDFLQCSFHASNSWMHRTEIILLQKLCKHKKSTFSLQVQSTYLHYKFKVHTYMLRKYYHSCVCICLVSILFHISLHYDDIFHVCKSLIQLYMHANTCDTFFVVYF